VTHDLRSDVPRALRIPVQERAVKECDGLRLAQEVPPQDDSVEGRTRLELMARGVVCNVQCGCFVMQALRRLVPVSGCTVLNGALLA